jgi:uncharacterized protein with FMN-binding domain
MFVCAAACAAMTLASCSKDDGDFRDSFTGVYAGTRTYTNSGQSYAGNITMTVAKSSVQPDKIVIVTTDTFYTGNVTDIVDAEVTSDGKFTASFDKTLSGVSINVKITNGKFSENALSFSFSADGYPANKVEAKRK